MKTATAKGSHNQSAINPFEVCRAKCNRVCGKYGRGNQCCKSKNRQVAHKTWQQNWHMRWKISCTKSVRRGEGAERGREDWQICQLAQLIKRKVLPATHVYQCTFIRVCVFSNPCQSWHILQRQTEIGCSRSRRRFLYGICMVCTHTHPDTEVHRGTQSHRQWKGALAQAVANWLHCRIERVLIANDLHLTETLKVLPIEDLLDKPKQTRTKLPPKRMDWWDPLFLFLSLSV